MQNQNILNELHTCLNITDMENQTFHTKMCIMVTFQMERNRQMQKPHQKQQQQLQRQPIFTIKL